MPLNIRIRGPEGNSTLNLKEDVSLQQFLIEVSTKTSIGVNNLELKKQDFPAAKPLPIPEDLTASMSVLGLKSGDAIIASTSFRPAASSSAPVSTQQSIEQSSAPMQPSSAAATPSSSSQISSSKSKIEGSHVRLGDMGYLVLRRVPDDNECCFRAAGKFLLPGDRLATSKLRQIVAETIRSNPELYSDVVLGSSRETYMARIQNPTAWGGAIELSILSEHFKLEIAACDIQTGRIDRYGEGQYGNRGLMLYSGIHYDPLSASPISPPFDDNVAEFDTILFSASDDAVLVAVTELAKQLKDKHYYTDTANFSLRCGTCKLGLKGEKDATEHAKQTGHTNFTEY